MVTTAKRFEKGVATIQQDLKQQIYKKIYFVLVKILKKVSQKSAWDVIKIRDLPSLFQGFSFPLLLSSSLIFMTSLRDFLRLLYKPSNFFSQIIIIYKRFILFITIRNVHQFTFHCLPLKIPKKTFLQFVYQNVCLPPG